MLFLSTLLIMKIHNNWNSTPPVLYYDLIWLPQTLLWLLEFDASSVVYRCTSDANQKMCIKGS
jgi:hypothetical protein